jgi:phospholipid/cholesterol/gamma-HCH transport system permease protein
MRELSTLAWLVNNMVACGLKSYKGTKKFYRWQNWRHYAMVGADSVPIVSTIAACTGMILSLQAAQQLEKVGALSYVANLVGVTITTELGPLLTAIILAGRSGAAFTAEIATMRISEEIDALEVIGVDPIRFLVWPKMLSMIIMVPALTVWADFVGIFAGGLFSSLVLDLNARDYFENTATFLKVGDLLSGLVKALGFGITITIVGCWQGFLASEGAADVGRRTTKSVVLSIFLIILLDLFFTALNYMFL